MTRAACSSRRLAAAVELAVAEVLEPRRLFAAIESGILVARGTSNADTFSLRRTGTDDVIVTTNGVNQTFDTDNFTGVRLEGLGGNDTFNMVDALVSPLVRNTTVLGGTGNDTISYATRTTSLQFSVDPAGSQMTSGAQVDTFDDVETVIGGSGADVFSYSDEGPEDETAPLVSYRLEGRGGADVFNDNLYEPDNIGGVSLFGGTGNDRFNNDEYGGESFFGEDGDDVMNLNNEAYSAGSHDGGSGADAIEFGGPTVRDVLDLRDFTSFENAFVFTGGPTTVIGTEGPNLIDASTREDVILQGLGGNDTLIGTPGNDTLDGGAGTDYGDGRGGTNTLISIENSPGGGGDPTSPSIAITGGVLVARGTGSGDTFSVRRTGTDNVIITVNALSREFDMDDFSGVRLEGFGGHDTFNMIDALTSPVVRNTTVLGGAGSDTISYATRTAALDVTVDPARGIVASGAQTDDFLGVETIVGGSGNDVFDYGNFVEIPPDQSDQNFAFRVEGRGGSDTFNDRLTPTLDDNFDTITLLGGDGNDLFDDDENPHDQFFGEAGNDVFHLFENAGASGGSGIDSMSVFTWDDTVDMRGTPDIENLTYVGTGFTNVLTVIGNDLSNVIDLSQRGDPVTVQGLGGNDTIIGSDNEDSLLGGAGNDSIAGLAGSDTLDGGSGTDTLDGGPGEDTLLNGELSPPPGQIRILNGVLTADGAWGGDDITLERVGTDDVRVTVNDLVRQFDMDDFTGILLRGNNGYDNIRVADAIVAGSLVRKVTIEGGNGDDEISCPFGGDQVIRGGAGNDDIFAGSGSDAIFGDAGNDLLSSGAGQNVVDADPDFFDGGDGNDRINSRNGGADTVLGGAGDDFAEVDAIDQRSGVEEEDVTP